MDTKSNDDSGGSDSLDKSMQIKCVMVESTGTATATTTSVTNPSVDVDADDSAEVVHKTEAGTAPGASSSANAFETKVKLISQNLQETTLAEGAGGDSNSSSVEDATTTHISTEESSSNSDPRLKKVRFHPDAKEIDGNTNRSKKKKKRRSAANRANNNEEDSTLSCDGMDLDDNEDEYDDEDDEEEEETEEEFDLAKTIAEAEDYLKQHPLTFVRRIEQNGERLRDGLLSIEDMPQNQMEEESDDTDEDFYRRISPENGIERILGKETKAGKVEFLLRYENLGGLFWESEEFIRSTCPTLLKAYEKNRERRQQRLMHHVAKRQSLRQRYTDF